MSGRSFRKQIRSAFCRNLKRIMKDRRLTQAGLAELAGMSPGQVSHYVGGRRCPAMDTMGRLALLLEVDLSELMKP